DLGVVRVVVELVGVTAATPGPGVLDGGVEGGPGEVESGPASFGIDDLALQPHQEAQALRVSLEASAVPGHLVQSSFPVVTEGWMSQVVGQAGRLHQVGVTTQRPTEFPADLGAFQGVGQAGTRK